MARAVVGFGSNIAPEENVAAALAQLAALARVRAVGTFYRTPPQGRTDQPHFVNGAVLVETTMDPGALQNALRRVEHDLGRVRGPDRDAPRTIDLDVSVYLDRGRLVHLDPDVRRYPFVAAGLRELVPRLAAPDWAQAGPEDLVPLPDLTARLRTLAAFPA